MVKVLLARGSSKNEQPLWPPCKRISNQFKRDEDVN
ncbi:unnamed protein product [Spirodela intermedia]|uniref:Uncharacterized protein n=1 Tax=Spirodela intermedia TaxID=51605 RepID=A0A7I8L400_SPIIN|nr:unnamed protein product [Spirodela intermedia]